MSNTVIGVDLGGTNFKAGRILKGSVEDKTNYAVNSGMSENELLEILYKTIESLLSEGVKGIGIGVPGIVDRDEGVIYDIQNLPAWKKVPLKLLLEKRFGLPVVLNNDANCFALGEHKYGKGQQFKNFVGVSIGTGLGAGVVIDNKLYSGVFCGAGEMGMIPYKDGIVEHYAGSFFFLKKYGRSAKEMHDLAVDGGVEAISAFHEFGRHLGEAIKIILLAYAPEAIVMGGSISKAYPLVREGMQQSLLQFTFHKQVEHLRIEISTLSDVAILGAGALCLE